MAPADSNPHSLHALLVSDEILKTSNLPLDLYFKPASEEVVEKTVASLVAKKHKVTVVKDKDEANELLKTLIPKGASINNAHSTTLEEIGFIDYLKEATEWDNIHAKLLVEKDWAKVAELRRQPVDYHLTSVSAITEDGELVVVDLSGNRTGNFIFTPKNIIVVAGTNKIVKDLAAGRARSTDFALPVESARVRDVYKVPASQIANEVIVHSGSPWAPEHFHVVLIKEALGY